MTIGKRVKKRKDEEKKEKTLFILFMCAILIGA
jgi:hypothetical protein